MEWRPKVESYDKHDKFYCFKKRFSYLIRRYRNAWELASLKSSGVSSLFSLSSFSNSRCCGYHLRYSIKSNQFISVTSTSTAQNYVKNRFKLTFSLISIERVCLGTNMEVSNRRQAEVTWVKTKNKDTLQVIVLVNASLSECVPYDLVSERRRKVEETSRHKPCNQNSADRRKCEHENLANQTHFWSWKIPAYMLLETFP